MAAAVVGMCLQSRRCLNCRCLSSKHRLVIEVAASLYRALMQKGTAISAVIAAVANAGEIAALAKLGAWLCHDVKQVHY